jgi:hypothetical protein
MPPGIPQGKELAIATTMEFALAHSKRATSALRRHDACFSEFKSKSGDAAFYWLRPREDSPMGKSPLGFVNIDGERLTAQASTLSYAAVCLTMLKRAIGADLRLRGVRWSAPSGFRRPLPGAIPWRR